MVLDVDFEGFFVEACDLGDYGYPGVFLEDVDEGFWFVPFVSVGFAVAACL